MRLWIAIPSRFLACAVLTCTAKHALAGSIPTLTSLSITVNGTVVSSVPAQTAVTLTATVNASSNLLTVGQVKFCDATSI
jgi:hypothetical protein